MGGGAERSSSEGPARGEGHVSSIRAGARLGSLMTALDPSSVDIVLVRPARSANVALACRAMKAMGLRRLCLAGTSADVAAPEARALAYGAWDVLDGAKHFETLAEAVRSSALVAGTSGRVFEGEVFSPRRLAEEGGGRAGAGRTSIVFGPERSGLSREELALCHLTVHIPTHDDQPSLNLAQAVLVEIGRAHV